jgi:DNA-binding NarL/FixJ family response regulator
MTPTCEALVASRVTGPMTLDREEGSGMRVESRVALVGHRDLVRNGLERIVSAHPGYEVLFVTSDVAHAVDDLRRRQAGDALPVVLLGSHGEHGAGNAAFAGAISALSEFGRVLAITEFIEARQLSGAIRAGAFGCVSGEVDEEELLLAIRTVVRGGIHVSPGLSSLLHTELRASGAPVSATLAPRETEALGWLAVGLTHREIAGRMGLTEATVSTYVKRIRSKLNARNKAELTRVAIELGLLDLGRPSVPG